MIAAVADNRVIGNRGGLPWHLPADLRRFKQVTLNNPIIMGRDTYESVGRPLPERRNIVLTRNPNYSASPKAGGIEIAHSIDEALELVRNEQQVFIVGGAKIYEAFLPLAHALDITHIHATPHGDTFFPEINPDDWTITSESHHPADPKHDFA
ncbi:MAG: dihydrofolate reductase, partial [Phycisphaeraceae bacterium]